MIQEIILPIVHDFITRGRSRERQFLPDTILLLTALALNWGRNDIQWLRTMIKLRENTRNGIHDSPSSIWSKYIMHSSRRDPSCQDAEQVLLDDTVISNCNFDDLKPRPPS